MFKEGHAGLSLILFSPFIFLFRSLGADMNWVLITYFLAVGLSSFPDIDMEYKEYGVKHRGVTHTFAFGIIIGVLFAVLMGYAYGFLGYAMGFVAGLGSTASHILGDTFTHERFAPFSPLSDTKIAFDLFDSSNKAVNNTMLGVGIVAFIVSYEPSIINIIVSLWPTG